MPIKKSHDHNADEKLVEISDTTKYLQEKNHFTHRTISESMMAIEALKKHPFRNNTIIQKAVQSVASQDFERPKDFKLRQMIQQEILNNSLFHNIF